MTDAQNTVVWLGGVMVTASDLRSTGRGFDNRFPAVPLPSSDSWQVVHTHVPLSPSSIIWYLNAGKHNGSMCLQSAVCSSLPV